VIHPLTFKSKTVTHRGGAVYAIALSFTHGPLISECVSSAITRTSPAARSLLAVRSRRVSVPPVSAAALSPEHGGHRFRSEL